jgi:hypothetical protein
MPRLASLATANTAFLAMLALGCVSSHPRPIEMPEPSAHAEMASALGNVGNPEPADDEHDALPAAASSADGSAEEASDEELPGAELPPAIASTSSPASKYAALDRASCERELGRRRIAFERLPDVRGVKNPLRLNAPLAGVTFHSMLSAEKRKTSPLEIYDCRLVLALDDFARILARHDVVEVVHFSVYRPPSARRAPARRADTSKAAARSRRGPLRDEPGRRHGGALAIDAGLFKTRDGRTLSVEKDFHGAIGARTCPPPENASELRKIACEAGEAQLFNVLLTPDYNRAHRNHFHMEVTAGARWIMVR